MGAPEEDDTIEQLVSFCRAAFAVRAMMRIRIGLVGSTSMGIYTGTYDHVLLRGLIGPEIVHYDSYTLINRAVGLTPDEYGEQLARLKEQELHSDVSPEDLDKAARFTKALFDICMEDGLDGINIKCQYEFSKEYGFVMCVPLSLLTEYGVTASCEGDILCSVSMEIHSLLSGQTVAYGDSLNLKGDVLTLSPCGFMPFSMSAKGRACIRKFMPHPGFSGIQCSFVPRPGPVTIIRVVEDIGSYDLLSFTGLGLETGLRQGYMPALDVNLNGRGAEFLQQANGQHYAFCYGDFSRELEYFATLTGSFNK
jgi:L-fucose isomerase-like protein